MSHTIINIRNKIIKQLEENIDFLHYLKNKKAFIKVAKHASCKEKGLRVDFSILN